MVDFERSDFFKHLSNIKVIRDVNEVKFIKEKNFASGNFEYEEYKYSYFYARNSVYLSVIDLSLRFTLEGFTETESTSVILSAVNKFNDSQVGIKAILKDERISSGEIDFNFNVSIPLNPDAVINNNDVFIFDIIPALTVLSFQPERFSNFLSSYRIQHKNLNHNNNGKE